MQRLCEQNYLVFAQTLTIHEARAIHILGKKKQPLVNFLARLQWDCFAEAFPELLIDFHCAYRSALYCTCCSVRLKLLTIKSKPTGCTSAESLICLFLTFFF